MHVSRTVLKELIEQKQLVVDYDDLEKQLTANGVDFRLAGIIEVADGGTLAIAKEDNKMPKLGKAVVLPTFEKRLDGYDVGEKIVGTGTVRLHKLKPYLVMTCESVNTPSNMMFHIQPRSSLFRVTQSALHHAFGEAGFKGYLTFMLVPLLDCEIELGARIAQLVFTELKGEASYEQQAESNYQGGKIF